MDKDDGTRRPPTVVPGFAIVGLMITGIAGLIHGIITDNGVSLIAAAIAFGFLAYISFGK